MGALAGIIRELLLSNYGSDADVCLFAPGKIKIFSTIDDVIFIPQLSRNP